MKKKHSDVALQKWIFPATVALATLAVIGVLAVRTLAGMPEWMYSYYFLNYEFEFVRRGFIGEMMRLASIPLSELTTSSVYVVGFLVVWAIFVAQAARLYRENRNLDSILFFAFLVLCPATTLHFAWTDFGRFDIFLVLLSISGAFVVTRLNAWPAFWIVILFQITALLIHEGALFLTAPLAFTLWWLRFSEDAALSRSAARFALFFGVLVIATAVIWKFGSIDSMTLNELTSLYSDKSTDQSTIAIDAVGVIDKELPPIGVLFYGGLYRNVLEHIWLVIGLFAHMVVIVRLISANYGLKKTSLIALAFSILAPLALYPLGHDFFRWWTFVFVNSYILLFFTIAIRADAKATSMAVLARSRSIIITGIIIGFLFGGLGDKDSFRPGQAPVILIYKAVHARMIGT